MSLEKTKLLFLISSTLIFLYTYFMYIYLILLLPPKQKEKEDDYSEGFRHGMIFSWLLTVSIFCITFYIPKITLP